MRIQRVSLFMLSTLLLSLSCAQPAAAQRKDWLPVTPEDLAYKAVAGVQGAHGVVLYREEYRDDVAGHEMSYLRIKILTEQGKEYGNVEIPFSKGMFDVRDIKARTIRPDGSIVNFDGKVFDKMLIKARGLKVQAKTFSLPEVQPGSIIEYRYMTSWDSGWLFSTYWQLQHKLFTLKEHFLLRSYGERTMHWVAFRVPGKQNAQLQKDGTILLDLENVPALEEEDYMPPEREVQMRIEFFYGRRELETDEQFWKREGKEWYESIEDFIGRRGGIARAAEEIVQPSDAPEAKLRKIYARVQAIRNLSFERSKTEKEEKREKLKDNNNIEDVWKRGYGYRSQINRLFVGLARAAGFEANVVRISERDTRYFHRNVQDPRQLDGEVAVVKVGAEERYFDPGTIYCPFGLLSWEKTGVTGIRPAKDGGVFVTTPNPASADAVTTRKASLRLERDGTMAGKVTVSYTGHRASQRRLDAREQDETARKKDLEDSLKNVLIAAANVKVEKVTGWEGSDAPLEVVYDVEIPGFAVPAGRRLLVPAAVFQVERQQVFLHSTRTHPIYFASPYREEDDITVQLPEGCQVESIPDSRKISPNWAKYEIIREAQPGKLRIQRRMAVEMFYFSSQDYQAVRRLFAEVKKGDEEQVVLRAGDGAAKQ